MAGRYVRLSPQQVAAASTGDGGVDWTSLLRPAGTLAKAAGGLSGSDTLGAAGTGLSGLASLAGGIADGNPAQAIGGAANVASGAANFAGYPDVGAGVGALGGPLSLATGLAKGDPLQSALGGLQTASTASGYLGGPTISSGVSALAEMLPGATAELGSSMAGAIGAETAGALGAGAETAGLAGLGGSLAGAAAAAPFAMMGAGALHAAMSGGGDMFDAMFGTDNVQAVKQMTEWKDYAGRWPGLVKDRVAGAGLFDDLDTFQTSEQIQGALDTATTGIRANDLSPAYAHLKQAPHPNKSEYAAKIPGRDMSEWEAVAPGLEGQNWGAWLGLADKAEDAGLDWMGSMRGLEAGEGRIPQAGPLTDYQHQGLDVSIGANVGRQLEDWTPGNDDVTTQEAYDLSNGIAGLGQQLGIDWGARGSDGRNQGYEIAPDELADYGFRPGQYGAASMNYLRSLDPGIAEGDKWDEYSQALGVTDEDLAGLPAFAGPFRSKYKPWDGGPALPLGNDIGGF